MFKSIRCTIVAISVINLSGCMIDGTNDSSSYYPLHSSNNSETMLYPDSYEAIGSPVLDTPRDAGSVVVPQTYHMSMGSPSTSKSVDRSWVTSQSPDAYTIQLASDPKASHVANVLYKAPKTERAAEVKTTEGNYKGLYGSYSTYDAATAELSRLPEDMRQGARVIPWNQIQQDLSN